MKPKIGTFYILEDKLYMSTFNGEGLDHNQLWKIIVSQVFKQADYETKQELINSPYGTDRGRVIWRGSTDERGRHLDGTYILYGTPGCEKHIELLKQKFNLGHLTNLKIDFKSDPHYKINPQHRLILSHVIKLLGSKISFKNEVIAKEKGRLIEKLKVFSF